MLPLSLEKRAGLALALFLHRLLVNGIEGFEMDYQKRSVDSIQRADGLKKHALHGWDSFL
jgi:hypothetical protein